MQKVTYSFPLLSTFSTWQTPIQSSNSFHPKCYPSLQGVFPEPFLAQWHTQSSGLPGTKATKTLVIRVFKMVGYPQEPSLWVRDWTTRPCYVEKWSSRYGLWTRCSLQAQRSQGQCLESSGVIWQCWDTLPKNQYMTDRGWKKNFL